MTDHVTVARSDEETSNRKRKVETKGGWGYMYPLNKVCTAVSNCSKVLRIVRCVICGIWSSS